MSNIPTGFGLVSFIHDGPIVGKVAVCTLGVQFDFADPQTVVNACSAAWIAQILNVVDNSWALRRTDMRVGLTGGVGPTVENGTAAAGLQTGSASPPNCALLIKKLSALGGRANRGRMYVPGLPEAVVDEAGSIDSTFRASAQTRFNNFAAALATATADPVILHDGPADPTPITAFTVQALSATQRRRLR
jgi:hypothetical protein